MQCHLSCLKSYFDPEAMIVFIHLMLVFIHLVQQVGDTGADIEEGKAAGCWTIAVLTGTQSREKLEAANPVN